MDNINDYIERYEQDSMNNMIRDNIESPDELQDQMDDFNAMPFDRQRDADDMSLSLTGKTNKERYEDQMKSFSESMVNISDHDIENAKQWIEDNNIYMVYPCEKLDALYNRYKAQSHDNMQRANWKALELYGCTNDELYEMLKTSSSFISVTPEGEEIKLIKLEPREEWDFINAPYFSPEEIENLDGMYSDNVSENAIEINKEYSKYYYGSLNEFDIIKWENAINELNLFIQRESINSIPDYNKINEYKESMLHLGWNPELEFTAENKLKAKNRLLRVRNKQNRLEFYDASSYFNSISENDYIEESAKKKKLYPISIVLIKGDSTFSNAITKVTHSEFSHSAICLDSKFNNLFSFNLNNNVNKAGGMSVENIDEYPENGRCCIFTFFVNHLQYEKIKANIFNLYDHIKDTAYSVGNIITLPFRNIDLDRDYKAICSQFVDKMIKLADIDLTNKSSSKVVPQDFYKNLSNNSKVYKIFDGIREDFNSNKAKALINRLSKKAKAVNESAIIQELRLPFKIKDDGDILLNRSFKHIDLNQAYFDSHKLLLQYEKANNLDGMKYECSRLYYMNYIIEKRMYSKYTNKKEDIKCRARILNDFNKYMKIILSQENDFNFYQYYENTPFYPYSIEVDSSTVKHTKDILKYIL